MRAVVQRVSSADVRVGQESVGRIGTGLLVLVGIGHDDGAADVQYLAGKIRDVRIFPDDQGKLNRSISEAGGAVVVVSQFTLRGAVRKGGRPSFDDAAGPPLAQALYEDVVRELRASGL